MKRLESTDLRIGNIILDSTKNTTRVETIIPQLNREQYGQPLNEEYMKAFGFRRVADGDGGFWYEKKFPVVGELCTSSKGNYVFDIETDTLKIKYVHELQNLYHSLTKKELQIKK